MTYKFIPFPLLLFITVFFAGCEREDSLTGGPASRSEEDPLQLNFRTEDSDMLELDASIPPAPEVMTSLTQIKLPVGEKRQSRHTTVVYTQTNATESNEVVAFGAAADGSLEELGRYATGGTGTGGGLGNQGALVLGLGGRILFAVNAGDNSLSAFYVDQAGGLHLLSRAQLNGERPVSVTSYRNLIYVVNAGSDDIEGLYLGWGGELKLLAGSRQPLSTTGTGPAQIAFKQNGRAVLVTEKATNRLTSYPVSRSGRPGGRSSLESATPTPFGFAFGNGGRILVSEAVGGAEGASSVTPYRLGNNGALSQLDAPLALDATAACWVVTDALTGNAFVTNTGSNDISSLRQRGATLNIINDGTTTPAVSAPTDAGLDRSGSYLYVLLSADDEVATYRVGQNGRLEMIDRDPITGPASTGIAVLN